MSLQSRVISGTPQDIVDAINDNIAELGTWFNMVAGVSANFVTYEDIPPSYVKLEEGVGAEYVLTEEGDKVILEESGI